MLLYGKIDYYDVQDICENRDYTIKELAKCYELTINQIRHIRFLYKNSDKRKPLTLEEKSYIIDLHNKKYSHRRIGQITKRHVKTISKIIMGLRKENPGEVLLRRKNFTSLEMNYVKRNYSKMTNREIAKHLNRTTQSIYGVAHRLGLKKPKENV